MNVNESKPPKTVIIVRDQSGVACVGFNDFFKKVSADNRKKRKKEAEIIKRKLKKK